MKYFTLMLAALISLIVPGCSTKGDRKDNSTKFTQYYRQGEQLYINNCSNCHQVNGKGLGRLYPPLAQSDFMEDHFDEVICLIRHGISDDLVVNGIQFNQDMPPNPALTDLEIAEIATFIYNSWEHNKGLIDVQQVTSIQADCDQKVK